MSVKGNKGTPVEVEHSAAVKRDGLIVEKIELAKKLGIWDGFSPIENYKDTPEHKRIKEINARLNELV